MKKILVTGSNGLLGSKLMQIGQARYEMAGLDIQPEPIRANSSQRYFQGDITRFDSLQNAVDQIQPGCLINTAAFTNVDKCETERDAAYALNAAGAENCAVICKEKGIKLIHVSTDYIFDGRNGPYSETDTPNPLSWYGKTKLKGEEAVTRILSDAVIARTMVLFGYGEGLRPNFITWLVDSLSSGKHVRIVDDQYGHATLAEDLAKALITLFEKNAQGIYHTAGKGWMNRYELALLVAEVFDLDASLIQRTNSETFVQPAPRPMQSGLNTDKIEKETGFSFPDIRTSLLEMKKQMSGL